MFPSGSTHEVYIMVKKFLRKTRDMGKEQEKKNEEKKTT